MTTVVAVPALTSPALADPHLDGTFPVSDVGTNNQITTGPDGNIWVTLQGAKDVARITPAGVVTEFDAANMAAPIGITTGPDGNLWVTQTGGVARFAPADPTSAVKFPLADITDPRAITAGPDSNLWTASGNKVLRIPPANPAASTSFAATGVAGARWITAGTDGSLWVADFGGQQIVRVTTAGAGTPFPTGGGPQGIAGGPNGQVAFADPGTNPQTIGRITTTVQTTAVPQTDPFGVAYASDGAYWIAQFAADGLGRLTPDGQYTSLPLGAGSGPRQITRGPNDTLWVTLDTAEKIARVSGVTVPAPPEGVPPTAPPAQVTTQLRKKPKKTVRTPRQKAKVTFRFRGSSGATFQCRLDTRKWRSCTSPASYRLRPGTHRFAVRAVLAGVADASPATWRFRIKRVR